MPGNGRIWPIITPARRLIITDTGDTQDAVQTFLSAALTEPIDLNPNAPLMSLRGIEKSFPVGAGQTYVLRRITLDIKPGEFVSIMGPSGAGKSTLLHILGMHDSAWSGEYFFMGQPIHALPPRSARRCRSATSGSSSRAITCSTT